MEAKHDSSIKYSRMRYGFKERVAKKKTSRMKRRIENYLFKEVFDSKSKKDVHIFRSYVLMSAKLTDRFWKSWHGNIRVIKGISTT